MRKVSCWWSACAVIATVSFGVAGCGNGSRDHDGESAEHGHAEAAAEHAAAEGEHAMAEGAEEHGRSESEAEHGEAREALGEHGGEHGEHGEGEGEHGGVGHDAEGEESGAYIGANETWDVIRRGARLILSFDGDANAFVGTVQNTTASTICAVRVEVHLSTGTELGPTARTDLEPGASAEVRLPTEGETFDTWTAHPEMSACSGD